MNNEPVAWWDGNPKNAIGISKTKDCDDWIPLYTHPAKTLTDEEILFLCDDHRSEYGGIDPIGFARAILRKANEK